jgi:hypothetical protein
MRNLQNLCGLPADHLMTIDQIARHLEYKSTDTVRSRLAQLGLYAPHRWYSTSQIIQLVEWENVHQSLPN